MGISIHDDKCFDLIPQAVLLALALERGMDPGTCRALAAIYKQLSRALKVTGVLGQWWQAPNGILQGCPLSVILVNVLSTIWKWEVDSLRQQVCARTAALPPTLDEDAPAGLEAGVLRTRVSATPCWGRRALRTTPRRRPPRRGRFP